MALVESSRHCCVMAMHGTEKCLYGWQPDHGNGRWMAAVCRADIISKLDYCLIEGLVDQLLKCTLQNKCYKSYFRKLIEFDLKSSSARLG